MAIKPERTALQACPDAALVRTSVQQGFNNLRIVGSAPDFSSGGTAVLPENVGELDFLGTLQSSDYLFAEAKCMTA